MAREVADLLPAAAAMPRTRTVRKDYFSLAEGPINSQLLKNSAPLMPKSYSRIGSLCSSEQHLRKERDVFSTL